MKAHLLILFLLLSCTINAQKFYEQAYRPDTVTESALYECLLTLNLFTDGAPDSLFAHFGSDTSIVHPDTLRKYSQLHLREYDFDNGVTRHPRQWTVSPTAFYCRRTFVGIGHREGDTVIYNGALVMTAELSYRNNAVVITKLSFRLIEVTKEIYDVLIAKRERHQATPNGLNSDDAEKLKRNIPPSPRPEPPNPLDNLPRIHPPY